MSEITNNLHLPESHLNILRILSALAWADENLSKEEIELLLEQFKEDLPANTTPISSQEYPIFTGFNLEVSPILLEQMESRINAELTFRKIINSYQDNPIPLADLVSNLETIEDRCLTVKLAYMLISVGYDPQKHSIHPKEKALYRQLIQLLDLDDDLVQEIEWEANQDLDKFQHPFKALLSNIRHFLNPQK
jgi:hypothetical protein